MKVRGRTEGAKGDCNTTGRTILSTILDPSELPKINYQPKRIRELSWSMAPGTYVVVDCLVWPQWVRMHVILKKLDTLRKVDAGWVRCG